MEKEEIVLKPKKEKTSKFKQLLEKKTSRHLLTCLFILPFLVAIGVFGFVAYKEAKNIIALINGAGDQNEEYVIRSMDYKLRDNATDIQLEYFTEFKNAIEVNGAEDDEIAGLVVKNYVADFYTWSNKQGQHDISALYYVYTPQKETIYTQARDGFYKYLNNYINDYGKENLLEIETVTVGSSKRQDYFYVAADEIEYTDVFLVSCSWSYKQNSIFSTSKYPTRCNFLVVKNNGRFEIVEASEGTINVEPIEEQD